MVKAKFVVDNREAGETEDCGLIVAIGLGEIKEENQFQLAVVGGKGLRGSMMVQGLADGIAEAISCMTDNEYAGNRNADSIYRRDRETLQEKDVGKAYEW